MGLDQVGRNSSYFSGCISPSCVLVHEEYSRLHHNISNEKRNQKKLKKLIKRIMSESKSIYKSTPLTFHYDAVSYSQNFDDGCHREEYHRR
ncbi:hypothetical protein Leryth_027047 [Lithospermum erythrorhizon]|nr:hypothetical protein Leryth_027047 [Lithospermum erythrorhizon]